MSPELTPLSSSQHRTHGWNRNHQYAFAAGDAVAPLLIGEIPAVLPYYPLAFARRPDGSCWFVALQGLHSGQNLFLSPKGEWQAGYIPGVYRGYPFALAKLEGDEQNRMALCFDRASGLYRENPNPVAGEERFFDDAGTPTPQFEKIRAFLSATTANRELTNRATAALEAAGLLEPWRLPLENPESERPLLQGLLRVNEVALNALDGQVLHTLREANALAVAYAQIFSTPRLGLLRRLHNLRAPQQTQKTLASLDELFGGGNDELIRFT